MENFQLEKDLSVFYVTARSFPDCIVEAFQELENKLPTTEGRSFFGYFFLDENQKMIYRAGVLETYAGEGKTYGLETFTLEKGTYLAEKVENWQQQVPKIQETFQKLGDSSPNTRLPGIEWYQGDDVLCMLSLAKQKA